MVNVMFALTLAGSEHTFVNICQEFFIWEIISCRWKKSPSGPNTLIFIWLKGFIQIYFPVILHNITVPCLFCEISSGVTSRSYSEPPPQKYLCGLILVMVLKYMKMFKYAGNAAKLYSKVSSVSWTENLKPKVNINQKWFMKVKFPQRDAFNAKVSASNENFLIFLCART